MAIEELSRSVDDLAKAVVEKTKELDELKKQYETKLELINLYIEGLALGESQKRLAESGFLHAISTPVKCSNCSSEVYNQVDSDYLLLPRFRIAIGTKDGAARLPEIHSETPQVRHLYESKASTNQSKRTCSYCKKQGHTRAKCLQRLSTPIS